jgi:lysophospholipase L1-like esterase
VQVGINDLKTIPLFPERKNEIIANCKANIRRIVQDSLELGSSVIITTIFPPGEISLFRRLVWSNEIDKAVVEVNHAIRQWGQDKVIVFDTAKLLSNANGKVRQEYRFDELHLNEQGYQALNRELISILKRLE